MRYRETRERSAEILRIVLALMARQKAAFHPASYALWYEHAAGINPALSQVLEQRIATNTALTDEEVLGLHAQHIVARDVEAIKRIEQRLLALLRETSHTLSDTGAHALQFGETLEGQTTRLRKLVSMESICEIVNELLMETQQMCSASVTLSRQLDISVQEVLTLTSRLEQVQAEAFKDSLTGLLNRRGLENAVAALHAQTADVAGTSVLLVDVDFFKRINDTYGHLVGDQVLRAVAQVLRARIKAADIAARVGGDEFAVLLPGTSMSGALALAEQVRTTVPQGRLPRIDRQEDIENVTLSVGVAYCNAGDGLEDMLHRADAALYAAKRSGRNRVSSEGASESDARDAKSNSSTIA